MRSIFIRDSNVSLALLHDLDINSRNHFNYTVRKLDYVEVYIVNIVLTDHLIIRCKVGFWDNLDLDVVSMFFKVNKRDVLSKLYLISKGGYING